MKKLLLLLPFLFIAKPAKADTALTLYDNTTHYFQMWPAQPMLQTYQMFMPATLGSAGQCFSVGSVFPSSMTLTYAACSGGGGGGSGIVSPGTFTWTNPFGIQSSTMTIGNVVMPTVSPAGLRQIAYWDNGVPSFGDAPGFSMPDATLFTTLVSSFNPVGGWYDDFAPPLSSSAAGSFRMTASRAEHVNLRNNSGTELGTQSNPIITSGTITNTVNVNATFSPPALTTVTFNGSAQPVTVSTLNVGGQPVSGSNPVPITGTISFNPPALTTVTFNGASQPVTQSGTWAAFVATTSVSINGSSNTVRINDGSGNSLTSTGNALDINIKTGSIANTGFNVNNAPTVVQSTSGVNGSTIAVVNAVGTTLAVSGSVSVIPPTLTTVTFNGAAQPVTSTSTFIINVPTVTFNGVAQPINGVVSTGTVVIASTRPVISGGISYNLPITTPTANGAAVYQWMSPNGARIAMLDCPAQFMVQVATTLPNSTTEGIILSSGGINIAEDLISGYCVNTSTTTQEVDLRMNGNGTANIYPIECVATDDRPIAGNGHIIAQLISNANWTIQQVTTSQTGIKLFLEYCTRMM